MFMVVHCSPLQLMHSSQSDCVVLNSCNVSGNPAVNLADLSLQPEHRQYFKEVPQNLTVVEGESVTLRLVANLDCIRFNVSNIDFPQVVIFNICCYNQTISPQHFIFQSEF